MLSTRSRFRVLSEIAEDELAELSQYSSGDPRAERAQAEARRERKRTKIMQEMFETEKTYLNHLELINKHFDFPLRFNCLIPEDVHSQIFSNIEQIMEVNKTLLEYMEQTTIGEAFKYLAPFLKLYSSYANNHENAITLLQEWRQKSSGFNEFIQNQEERPDMMGLKVNALLITPVQRVPRYKLLLEDLLENTQTDHHDFEELREAVQKVSDIATHINNHIKQHENFQKMLSIQKCFDKSAPKILTPGREFIKEGILKKVSKRGGKPHDRMFFLFSDILLYGKPRLLDSLNNSYTCCCVLPLKHCQLETVFGGSKRGAQENTEAGGMFKITCKDESLLLFSNDPEEMKSWTNELGSAIRKLSNNRSTLRKPSSNKAPMRGRSLWKQMKLEKQRDQEIRRIIKKDDTDCNRLSPLNIISEVDTNKCLSPWKRAKLCSTGRSSTPVGMSSARKARPIRPPPPSSTQSSENIPPPTMNPDHNFALSPVTASHSDSEEEDSFLQMTMGDIGNATVEVDSFCRLGREAEASTNTERNRDGLNQGGRTFQDHHSQENSILPDTH
uniref:Rho guanine nucleotide exchange factor 39-like isoform X1 n=2 Tax=Crassostrea virginica TaxID=6565 RepID=A0A8B8E7D8_CRAVI|nr:rho guanine nucleotide exchange factor 39-like isoform X1 [Crassostrea virginica]XP_022335357.1 rho guanine nucleotide exchange factor 39-like isoform X1 [Crassostrea virginica]XP_022335358.1 rho guanine nucleotide exchange factor 39-like isoform X1 [Crassostrea virginica]XP_022335359.1 rho guanine nucleotide exchange factor 39-like isoform X1 [Crassostrea virginica]XP_022335360.1 rho guanine nucleotide exchange factor 39-like isoform X1 [Crassostrea virginica]XP_022335361.1 rho guanine nuc